MWSAIRQESATTLESGPQRAQESRDPASLAMKASLLRSKLRPR
jgi:hypothetical protein